MKNLFFSAMMLMGMLAFAACAKKADEKKADAKPQASYEAIAKDAEEITRGLCACDLIAKDETKKDDLETCKKINDDMQKEFDTKYTEELKNKEITDKLAAQAEKLAVECAELLNAE